MKFYNFFDLIISGAFALGAFLIFMADKLEMKKRREYGTHEGYLGLERFRRWVMLIVSIIISLVYFVSFINSFSI